ncbi:hypothetical protein GRI58_15110 [Porphyrobacter algicida]|uniref:DUF6161 domain-containing protein n=1 Tax=Qipengyuania algicida TaxID=1836209 RepID=A0A845AL48_9SPHN|nr:hypothetical protein [Qipengyuania algicida]
MATEELTFSIGPDGKVTVRSFDELLRWIEKERASWSWLVRGDGSVDRHNIATNVQNNWDNIIANLHNLKNNGSSLIDATPHLSILSGHPLLVSTTKKGGTVLDIREAAGDQAAAFAYGLQSQQFNLQNMQIESDFKGALLSIFPNLADDLMWHERLKQERVNFKNATRSVIERVDKEADERIAANIQLTKRASKIAKRIFDMRRDSWTRAQTLWQQGATNAVADINATDAAYKEFMKLKAPVEYWTQKAKDHGVREDAARYRLYLYFPITLVFMLVAFVWVADFLINHPDTSASKAPLALYFVVSGGLILLSSIAFWIGRILTKLYLSEHHLRNDAEERAVMTTTYLALTNDGSASDADRQIVLNALFRATPDGIVKDDGPADASIQGLIARMAAR